MADRWGVLLGERCSQAGGQERPCSALGECRVVEAGSMGMQQRNVALVLRTGDVTAVTRPP